MKNRWWLLALLVAGCNQAESRTSIEDAGRTSGGDEIVALADVPAHVKEAALKAVPGLVLTEAERELEHGVVVFSLTGTVDGKRHEVEVTSSGTVQEIETGDDDEDDEDEDEDEDDREDDR